MPGKSPSRPCDVGSAFVRLAGLMEALRGEGGCPWDREQTLLSLRRHLVEECCETLDAMVGDDSAAHCEELGDLLLQIVFQAQIRAEAGAFHLRDVAEGLCEKLVRRHPHVFGGEAAPDVRHVQRRWEEIKAQEKPLGGDGTGALGDLPRELPAAAAAQTVQRRAARVGFDWSDAEGALAKLEEEVRELRAARVSGVATHVAEEVGDLLFAAVNVGRLCGVSCEDALRDATCKFRRRFERMEALLAAEAREMETMTAAALDACWAAVKREERARA
jgi:MazG family protein